MHRTASFYGCTAICGPIYIDSTFVLITISPCKSTRPALDITSPWRLMSWQYDSITVFEINVNQLPDFSRDSTVQHLIEAGVPTDLYTRTEWKFGFS
jgi:hypothetical protein